VEGPEEYAEFSKAIFGEEATLGLNPDNMSSIGDKFQFLPLASTIWRYQQYYHSYLPSLHDVVTGMWKPTTKAEIESLSTSKFCTFAALIKTVLDLKENNQEWSKVEAVGSWEPVKNGSLGLAYRSMMITSGIYLDPEAEKDYQCSKVGVWPQPAADATP